MADDNRVGKETSLEELLQERSTGTYAMVILGVLACPPAAGWLVAQILGDLSKSFQVTVFASLFSILVLGWGLWLARLSAVAFGVIGNILLRFVSGAVTGQKKSSHPEGAASRAEKDARMAVRLQRTSSSFFIMSIPIAAIAGFIAMFSDSAASVWLRVGVIFGLCLAWGSFLTYLAKHGYLPLPSDQQ